MFIAIIFTVLPTLFFYLVLNRFIKSTYLKISLSWFSGQYILTILTFLLALVFSLTQVSGILQKAVIVPFVCLSLLIPSTYKQILLLLKAIKLNKIFVWKATFLLFIFLFSVYFYTLQLKLENGNIYTSPAYWDFQWHAPLIQNFVYGDNFPPQNESFANMPSTYHFFWGFLVSIYSASGLDLVSGINYISIISLFFMLTSIIGLGEELFKSFKVGILSAFLTITSSSLHFIDYFRQVSGNNMSQIIKDVLTNKAHPFFFSFVSGNPNGYNGTMFNMFYFLAERQMVVGVIFLIFFIWLVYKRNKIPFLFLALIGALAGGYFLWHLFITISIFCSLLFLVIFDKDKKRSLILLFSFSFIFFLFILYFKKLTNSIWFYQDIGNYPKINFNFPTMGEEYPFSITNAIGYYIYAYGLKLVFLIAGSLLLFRSNKKLLVTLLSIIVPTFILTNTIQLSPLSVYDNHKWLRPMSIIIDFLAAFAIYKIMIYKKKPLFFISGAVFFILITISGVTEIMPFFNSKPTNLYANYQSHIISTIRENTDPKAVFLGNKNNKEIQLAGRKLFLGDYPGQDLRLRKDLRERIIDEIYSSNNLRSFCSLTLENKIDYVEIQGSESMALIDQIFKFNADQRTATSFIDVKKSCGISL